MQPKRQVNIFSFGLIYFGMFVLAYLLNKDGKVILFPKFGPDFLKSIFIDSMIGIAAGGVVVLLSQAITKKSKALQELGQEFYRMIGPLKTEEIFFLAFFSSVGEEFLFRGILQAHVGVLIASIIFGLLHTAPGRKGLAWSIFALSMGLVMGLMYIWRGDLLTPIWTHFIVNFMNIYLMQKSYLPKKS